MKWAQIINGAVNKAAADLGVVDARFVVEHPAMETNGDYSTNIALVAWQGGKVQETIGDVENPRQLAELMVRNLEENPELQAIVSKIEIAGPGFINFWIKEEALLERLNEAEAEGEKFGMGEWGKDKLYEVEHTSPNPNKAMHLGQLRNNLTGMAIARLFEAGGIKVIRDAVDNNRGIAIAKLMWGYLKFAKKDGKETEDLGYWFDHQDEWQTPEGVALRADVFMDQLYVKGASDCKENEAAEKRVRQMVIDWEAEDEQTWALWKKVLDYVYEGQNLTLKRLGSKWDRVWHEHEHYKEGKKWVEKGLQNGVFRKLDDGAVLTDLEKYGLTDTIVQKSDGTALYITQDLALTELKKKTYQADRLFWVIGPEQSLDLKQMFAVCEQLGIGKIEEFTHIAYGYMSIKGQGKMSSRLGNVVYIDQLIDLVKERVIEKIKERDFAKEEAERVAEGLALGAVKYSILKMGRMTDMAFDIETSVSFEGDSGPYLNYVYVRTQRILEKAGKRGSDKQVDLVLNAEELGLLRFLYRFPEVVESAGRELAPNLICGYLLELAKRFNLFYLKHSVLEGGESREFRQALTAVVGQVVKNGLNLLGIEPVEKM